MKKQIKTILLSLLLAQITFSNSCSDRGNQTKEITGTNKRQLKGNIKPSDEKGNLTSDESKQIKYHSMLTLSGEKNRELDFEAEIFDILNAFKTKDEKRLNARIDTSIGFYIIPGPGTLLHFEKSDYISFAEPLMAYHQFGVAEKVKYKIIEIDEFPEYSCENRKWNKNGLFLIRGNAHIFTNILDRQLLGGQKIVAGDPEIAKKIDPITKTVILAQKDSDIIFGVAEIKGRLILTYLDLSCTYCDI